MNKEENETSKQFWTEGRLRTAHAIWMIGTNVSYLSTVSKSDHEGVILLPKEAEVIRVTTTPNGSALFFIKVPYPVFLEWVRNTTLDQKISLDKRRLAARE